VYNRRVKAPVIRAVSVITRSLWVRFHRSLILLMVLLAGIGSSIVLRRLGVRSMPGRYVFAVLLGYALGLPMRQGLRETTMLSRRRDSRHKVPEGVRTKGLRP
jgi:hypothetical protein